MAATGQGINVLRYSALLFGVFYGISHSSSVKASAANAKAQHEFDHKAELISKAKAEWTKKNLPAESTTAGGKIITDPSDPNFDLEGYLNMAQAGEA